MSGRRSRNKGLRVEREIVNTHKLAGIHAERVPLSGAAGGAYSGDIDIYVKGKDSPPWVAECKAKASESGFKLLYKWLGDNDMLIVKADRKQPLMVIPMESWLELLFQAGANK